MGDLRAMSYNPVNTLAPAGRNITASSDAWVAAPDGFREKVFTGGGLPDFYGINLMELNELGRRRKFTRVYSSLEGNNTSLPAWVPGDNEIAIGLDRSRESLIRAVATDAVSGAEFTLMADDQYSVRQQKIGYYGAVEEGRMVVDNRVLTGIVIRRR